MKETGETSEQPATRAPNFLIPIQVNLGHQASACSVPNQYKLNDQHLQDDKEHTDNPTV